MAEIKKCISDTVNQYNLSNTNTGEETELSVNPHIFWELLKCTIRGKTISYTSYLKKKSQREESELEQQLNISQNRYALHPDQELKTEIQNIEESLKTLREKKME